MYEAARQVQPDLRDRDGARCRCQRLPHAQPAGQQRAGRSAEQRTAADRQGQCGARLHLGPDHQAARDADEVRVPAPVGAESSLLLTRQ